MKFPRLKECFKKIDINSINKMHVKNSHNYFLVGSFIKVIKNYFFNQKVTYDIYIYIFIEVYEKNLSSTMVIQF